MNATLAHYLAEAHVADLRREAQRAQLAETAKRNRPTRETVGSRRRPLRGLFRSPGPEPAADGSPA